MDGHDLHFQHPPPPLLPPSPSTGLPFLLDPTQPVPDFAHMAMDDIWMPQEPPGMMPPPPSAVPRAPGGPGGVGGFDTFLLDPMKGHFQLHQQPQFDNHDDGDEQSYGSDSDFVIDDDDLSSLDDDDRPRPTGKRPPYLPPSVLSSVGSSGSALSPFVSPTADWLPGGNGNGRGGWGRGGRGGGNAGGGIRGRRKASLDVQQMSRRLKQKADSYERKKSRAKACRKVLKERFETLLKVCGDPHIRRSDKVGLLTRAIDLITGMRQQLGPLVHGAFFGGMDMMHHAASGQKKGARHSTRNNTRGSNGITSASAAVAAAAAAGPGEDEDAEDEDEPPFKWPRRSSRTSARTRKSATQWIPVNMVQHGQLPPTTPPSAHMMMDPPAPPPKTLLVLPPATTTTTTSAEANLLLKELLTKPKVTDALLPFLDPPSLEACRGVAATAWHRLGSDDAAWRELCRLRWKGCEDLELGTASWREVYATHAQALHKPCLPPSLASLVVVASGCATGVVGWLMQAPSSLIPLPSPTGMTAHSLLLLHLVVQNVAHDMVTIPHQRFEVQAAVGGGDKAKRPPVRTLSHLSSTTTASSHSSSSSSSCDDEQEETVVDFTLLWEPTAPQLKELGVDVAYYQPYLMSCNETKLEGEGSIPWASYEGVGGLRLGLFDTAVLAFYVLVSSSEMHKTTDVMGMAKETSFVALVPPKIKVEGEESMLFKEEEDDESGLGKQVRVALRAETAMEAEA